LAVRVGDPRSSRCSSLPVTIRLHRYFTDPGASPGRILMEAFGGTHLDYRCRLTRRGCAGQLTTLIRCAGKGHGRVSPRGIERQTRATGALAVEHELRGSTDGEQCEQVTRACRLSGRYKTRSGNPLSSDADGRTAVQDSSAGTPRFWRATPEHAAVPPLHVNTGGVLRCQAVHSRASRSRMFSPTFEHMERGWSRAFRTGPAARMPSRPWIYDFLSALPER